MMKKISLVLLWSALWAAPVLAQPSLSSVTHGGVHNGATVTINLNVASNSNRLLYVGCGWLNLGSAGDDVTGVTWNGSATGVTNVTEFMGGTAAWSSVIYRVIAPATGTHDAVISFAGVVDAYCGVYSLYNAQQTSPETGVATAHASSGDFTVTVNSTTTDLVFGMGGTYSNAPPVMFGSSTERYNTLISDSLTQGFSSSITGAMTSTSLVWLNSTGLGWSFSGVSVQVFSGSSSTPFSGALIGPRGGLVGRSGLVGAK